MLSTNRDVRRYVLFPLLLAQRSRCEPGSCVYSMNTWLRNYPLLVPSSIFFQNNLSLIVYILLYGNRILVSDGDFPWLNIADSFLLKIIYCSNCPHDRVVFPMGDGTILPFAPYLMSRCSFVSTTLDLVMVSVPPLIHPHLRRSFMHSMAFTRCHPCALLSDSASSRTFSSSHLSSSVTHNFPSPNSSSLERHCPSSSPSNP